MEDFSNAVAPGGPFSLLRAELEPRIWHLVHLSRGENKAKSVFRGPNYRQNMSRGPLPKFRDLCAEFGSESVLIFFLWNMGVFFWIMLSQIR